MQVGLLGSDPHPELVHSIGDIRAQHDVMCKMDREIGTRPPMSDNQQTVHYVAGFLTTRRDTHGKWHFKTGMLKR
jgi:hypothetical protein